ncbi:hypothetical protein J6S88_01020, partial [bacterium]|nr:hypothetical protein [bacterium]
VDKRTIWKCECECGNIVFVESYSLKNGNTKSCGCLKYDSRNYTHKHSSERIYKIWLSMKARCFYKTNHAYKWYGAIGIRVCDEWKNDFMSFYNWSMENGYSEHLSIDRIDVNGNYEPNNCRWTTMEVQQNNRRNTTYIEYNGMKKTISEWSKITGIKRSTLYNRIKIGYTPEECFNVKLCSRRGRKRENM